MFITQKIKQVVGEIIFFVVGRAEKSLLPDQKLFELNVPIASIFKKAT